MPSSRKVPNQSGGLTRALEVKFKGLVTGKQQRLVLWLPLHRTPAHNILVRANRWRQHALTGEAQQAVLTSHLSVLPCSESVPSMRNPNMPR